MCSLMMKLADSFRLGAPPPSRKLWDVSGSVHPRDEIADSLRLRTLFVHSTHENWGTSQALRTPMMKIVDRLRLCAPPARKLGDVSGSVHPHDEIADSLRLWALFAHSARQNWGTPQARCTPVMKICNSFRF